VVHSAFAVQTGIAQASASYLAASSAQQQQARAAAALAWSALLLTV
jgi:hypothetical protein